MMEKSNKEETRFLLETTDELITYNADQEKKPDLSDV